MNPRSIWLIAASAVLTAGTGICRPPQKTPQVPAFFAKLQQTVAAAGKNAAPSLALVKIERDNDGASSQSPVRGMNFQRSSAASGVGGIVLTSKGHVLTQGLFRPDQDQRITVLIGENEYVARAVKADETLGMSIIKLDSAETFVPLDLSAGADLAVGEWAVVLKPTDEEFGYRKLVTPAVCQGEKEGIYREFILNEPLAAYPGSLVVNLSGQLVGLVDRGSVLAINDLRDDIQRLLTEMNGSKSLEDEKKMKGWLGAALVPVNKEFAKARNLSPSSLQVVHVAKDSPAATAGLRDGDLIIALNGKPLRLTGGSTLDYFTKSLHPRTGEKFTITALRADQKADYSGTFTRAPEPETLLAKDIGVTVSGITDSGFFSLDLATDQGVLVTDVIKGSPAANSGTIRQTLVSRYDVIIEMAGQPTPDLATFGKVLETIRHDHPPVVLVKYYRGRMTGYAGLNLALGEKDNGNKQ